MKTENRQKTLLIITAVVVALYVGDNFVIEPLIKWWGQRAKEIASLRIQVNDGRSLIRRESVIHSEWDGMRTNTLPNDSAQAEREIISAFDRWQRESGVEITGLLPQWKSDTDDYQTLNCRVEASGTLSTLSQFLYFVERGPMGLKLDSLELGTRDSTGDQMTLAIQVSGLALTDPNPTHPTAQP